MDSDAAESTSAVELKGGMFTLTVLRVLEADKRRIAEALAEKVQQAPVFFQNVPVILDLEPLAESNVELNFSGLLELIRGHGMVPLGIRNGSVNQQVQARQSGLGIFRDIQREKPAITGERKQKTELVEPETHSAEQNGPASQMVDRPVRSGQQIYAAQSDLVVVAQASAGSELLADGSIHVYGPLRGRALAGVNGNKKARIFCLSLEAELVSIAGVYRVFEDLDPKLKGQPAQIRLDNNELAVLPIRARL